jgi:hypothetical protein
MIFQVCHPLVPVGTLLEVQHVPTTSAELVQLLSIEELQLPSLCCSYFVPSKTSFNHHLLCHLAGPVIILFHLLKELVQLTFDPISFHLQ